MRINGDFPLPTNRRANASHTRNWRPDCSSGVAQFLIYPGSPGVSPPKLLMQI